MAAARLYILVELDPVMNELKNDWMWLLEGGPAANDKAGMTRGNE
jgi:hypothetical protein